MVQKSIEDLRAKAKFYKTRWPVYDTIIDWLVDLLIETVKADNSIFKTEIAFEKATVDSKLAKGIPLFNEENFPLDIDVTRKLYQKLITITGKHRGHWAAGLGRILSGSKLQAGKLLKRLLAGDSRLLQSVCEKENVDAHAAEFILRLSLHPSLTYASRSVSKIDLSQWSFGHCPVCGSLPILSELPKGKSGRRLYCAMCETSWAYPRFRCPFCERKYPNDKYYLYSDEEHIFRVDVCEQCGRALNSIDARQLESPIIPVLDNLIFTHLNLAIENRKV